MLTIGPYCWCEYLLSGLLVMVERENRTSERLNGTGRARALPSLYWAASDLAESYALSPELSPGVCGATPHELSLPVCACWSAWGEPFRQSLGSHVMSRAQGGSGHFPWTCDPVVIRQGFPGQGTSWRLSNHLPPKGAVEKLNQLLKKQRDFGHLPAGSRRARLFTAFQTAE